MADPKIFPPDGWSPFEEADYHLDRYDNFFPRTLVGEAFGKHPQELEDWLGENCPNNYCYAWVYQAPNWNRDRTIIGNLMGIPADIAMALKLITSMDILHSDSFIIKKTHKYDNVYSYHVEQLDDSTIRYRSWT